MAGTSVLGDSDSESELERTCAYTEYDSVRGGVTGRDSDRRHGGPPCCPGACSRWFALIIKRGGAPTATRKMMIRGIEAQMRLAGGPWAPVWGGAAAAERHAFCRALRRSARSPRYQLKIW